MNRIAVVLAGALLLCAGATAQESAPQDKVRTFTFEESKPKVNFFFQSDAGQQLDKVFYLSEMNSGGELITNAPYTANAVEESTQTLADGNRIVRKSSDFVARDSQGRTRRESSPGRIGSMETGAPKMIFINDPTTHTQYFLTAGNVAKVVKNEATWSSGPTIIDLENGEANKRIADKKVAIARRQGVEGKNIEDSEKQVRVENLGTQTIEGLSAEGRRETTTIAAGQIGNERPIEIVTETWTSPDLHTVVLRKHTDPRAGETVFRLTNITRNEPDAALFQPPPNAKIKVEPVIELKRREAPPKD